MGEDIELQTLETLVEKWIPIQQDWPFTYFKRYPKIEEINNAHKVVLRYSIPWSAKIPWDYNTFPGIADLWCKARLGIFHRYHYQNFNFKSLLEYSYSRPFLRTKVGFRKNGFEIAAVQGSSLQKAPEYVGTYASYVRPRSNSRVNFIYIPEVSSLVMTTSGLWTRYVPGTVEDKYGIYPRIYGGEVSCEVIPLRLMRLVLLHRRYYDQNKLTIAYKQKFLADETYERKLLLGYTFNLQRKKKLFSCLSFDLKHNNLLFHLVYSRPHNEDKGSRIRYKISSAGTIGTDIIVKKKNMLVAWNFELNLGPLAQRESFGIFKFGVRIENIYEKLMSNVP